MLPVVQYCASESLYAALQPRMPVSFLPFVGSNWSLMRAPIFNQRHHSAIGCAVRWKAMASCMSCTGFVRATLRAARLSAISTLNVIPAGYSARAMTRTFKDRGSCPDGPVLIRRSACQTVVVLPAYPLSLHQLPAQDGCRGLTDGDRHIRSAPVTRSLPQQTGIGGRECAAFVFARIVLPRELPVPSAGPPEHLKRARFAESL